MRKGVKTLRQSGLTKVAEGVTTIEEVPASDNGGLMSKSIIGHLKQKSLKARVFVTDTTRKFSRTLTEVTMAMFRWQGIGPRGETLQGGNGSAFC